MVISECELEGGAVDTEEEAKLIAREQRWEGPRGDGVGEARRVVSDVKGNAEVRLEMEEKGRDFGGSQVSGEAFGPEIGGER